MTSSPDSLPTCVVDRAILNADTVLNLTDMGLSIFASACGRNRGAFVVDPPDGHTYSCLSLPAHWAVEVGAGTAIPDSNAIKDLAVNGTIAPEAAVDLLDLLTQAVYKSSSDVAKTPYGCDISGLAKLECNDEASSVVTIGDTGFETPIRAVTLAGLLVPETWATGDKVLTMEEAKSLYTSSDFEDMKELGLNAVYIKIDDFTDDAQEVLEHVLGMVGDAGLYAILSLAATDKEQTAVVAGFAASESAVLGLVLPDFEEVTISAARAIAPSLPLFLPANEGDLVNLKAATNDPNIFAALDMSHSSTVADVASGNSLDDRMKLFYHESISCIKRSPIEYTACFRGISAFVSSGFDLSIDDCILQSHNTTFHNYGQCDRFPETIGSGWWASHRESFAARQLFAFERGLGWSFATWKLFEDDEDTSPDEINSPAKLLALKNVVAAGLFPSLHHHNKKQQHIVAKYACLNPPKADFVLGDKTLSPTPGPPPDCGNGWWNYTINDCTYWIPPATEAPTLAPPEPLVTTATLEAGAIGAVIALILGAIGLKLCKGRSNDYDTIPN